MRWLLISGERERDQGLESLRIVQPIEHDETLTKNTIRISSWRGVDQVQDLRGHLLRKNSYCVVELGLAHSNVPDSELQLRLARKHAASPKRWLPAELPLKLRLGERAL